MKELITRGIFGLVFLLFVFAPFIVDLNNNQNIFNLTLYAFAMLGTFEVFKLSKNTPTPSNYLIPGLLLATALFLPMLLETLRGLFPESNLKPIWLVMNVEPLIYVAVSLTALGMLVFSALIFRKKSIEGIYKATFLLNALYVSIPLALLSMAYSLSSVVEKQMLLIVLLPIYLNDTFAYLSGRLFGKHLMFPSVSPKKTWEGFVGGVLIAALGMVTLLYVNRTAFTENSHYIAIALVSMSVSVLATLGDLFESKLKRTAQVKDSGSILPGHGGILDRIDAMLFAAPLLYVSLWLFF